MTTQDYRRRPVPAHVRERSLERLARLRQLGYASYRDYLGSRHWLRLRTEYGESDLPQFCICGDDEIQLHHLTYERVGAERLTDLTPLCRRCHSLVHVLEWRGEVGLDLDGLCDEERAQAARAWMAVEVERRTREQAERVAAEKAYVLSLSFTARVVRARRVLKARHMSLDSFRILKGCARNGASDRVLTKRLRILEAQAYGWDDWPL